MNNESEQIAIAYGRRSYDFTKCAHDFIKISFENVTDLDFCLFQVTLPEMDCPKVVMTHIDTVENVFVIFDLGKNVHSPSAIICNNLIELRDALYNITPHTNIKC